MASKTSGAYPAPTFPPADLDDAELIVVLIKRLTRSYPDGVPKAVLFAAFQHAKGRPVEEW